MFITALTPTGLKLQGVLMSSLCPLPAKGCLNHRFSVSLFNDSQCKTAASAVYRGVDGSECAWLRTTFQIKYPCQGTAPHPPHFLAREFYSQNTTAPWQGCLSLCVSQKTPTREPALSTLGVLAQTLLALVSETRRRHSWRSGAEAKDGRKENGNGAPATGTRSAPPF